MSMFLSLVLESTFGAVAGKDSGPGDCLKCLSFTIWASCKLAQNYTTKALYDALKLLKEVKSLLD